MGSEQTAHFDDVRYSRFAGIDPDHSSVSVKDERPVFWANASMSIGRGVVSGLQETLGDLELTAYAAAVSTAIDISLSAIEAPVAVAVVAVLGLIPAVIWTIQSLFISTLYNDLICKIDRKIKENTVIFLYLFGEVSG